MIALELDENMALIPDPCNPEMKVHTSRKVKEFFYSCLKCSNMTPPQNLQRFVVLLQLRTCYWAEGRKNEPRTGVTNYTIGDGDKDYNYS